MSSDYIGDFKRFRDLLKREFYNNSRFFYFNDTWMGAKVSKIYPFYGKCGYNIQRAM